MAKECTTETKIKLCGLYIREPQDYVSDKKDYEQFLNSFNIPVFLTEYKLYLYDYGAFQRHLLNRSNSESLKKEFEQQDKAYDTWVKMCQQLEGLLSSTKSNSYYYKYPGESVKNELFFPDVNSKARFQEIMIKCLIEELCLFENARQVDRQTKPEDISIVTIQSRLKEAKKKFYELYGVNRGCPTSMVLLMSQTSIRLLSYLIRIDRFFTDILHLRITELPLANDEYSFVYHYLDYFGLLAYEKLDTNTTTPEKLIRERLKSFPKANNPVVSDGLLQLEGKINEVAAMLKRLNAREE